MKLRHRVQEIKYWYVTRRMQRLSYWVAWRLPRWLVAKAAIRLIAHATTGPYGNQVVPELNAMEALRRWDAKHMNKKETSCPSKT